MREESYTESANVTYDIMYLYDESSIIGCTIKRGNLDYGTYYFQRNLLGDVVAIYNTAGTKVESYVYDAFGNCTSLNNSLIGKLNPIRYRGYYYDRETKLYYLNARYYNPEWRRFISPDSTEYIDPDTPNGLNLYAYCNNDPVNYIDPSGHSILVIGVFIGISTIVGAAAGAFTAACTGGNIVESAIEGAITGLIAATAAVFVPQIVAFAISSSLSSSALTALSLIATFSVASAGGLVADISIQAVSHALRQSNEPFTIDWKRATKTAIMTGVAGIVPTFVDPTKSVLNAIAGAVVGMDASFINAAGDIIFTKAL